MIRDFWCVATRVLSKSRVSLSLAVFHCLDERNMVQVKAWVYYLINYKFKNLFENE